MNKLKMGEGDTHRMCTSLYLFLLCYCYDESGIRSQVGMKICKAQATKCNMCSICGSI